MHYLARCSLSELNTLWEWGDLSISESNLRPPLIWYVESHELVTSPTNQRGKLKAVSHREHLLTGAASVITHQLSLKGKPAADVAEVAKHLNITHDVRDAENAGGIAECSHIMEFTV